MTVYKRFL